MIELLHVSATVLIGLYAGSLLTEAMILVPYWRRMQPAEFFGLHVTLGPRLFRYYAPLTALAVAFAVFAGLFGGALKILAAGLCLSALIIYFVYFKKANASFAAHSLKDEDLGAELKRWANWHWLRTIIVIFAFIASVAG
ncbi:MAG: hypothetical protein ABJO36_06770 [Litorimonas sp.]